MRNKKVKILSLAALLCTSITAAAIIFSNKSQKTALADESDYSLSLTSFDPSSSSSIVKTKNGNDITFSYSGYSSSAGNWGIIADDGYIKNSTQISGLKSISVSFITESIDLSVSYGWYEDDYVVTSGILNSSSQTYTFNDETPCFFILENNSGEAITISSISLTYSCSESELPEEYNMVNYMLLDGRYYLVSSYKSGITKAVIPSTYKGLPITGFWPSAFKNCSTLVSVDIRASIISIGSNSFSNCTSLESVKLPSSLTMIKDSAFAGCSSLRSFMIPENVATFSAEALKNCSSLENVYVDENNDYFCSENGVLYNKDKTSLVKWPAAKGGALTFAETTTRIDNYAFYGCSFSSIIIPETVTDIGGDAFANCSNLLSVVIPSSVLTIGYEAFCGCSKLNGIVIPDNVTALNYQLFRDCTKLSSVILPSNLETIGNGVFSRCFSLSNITLPESLTSIGDNAFESCTSLESIIIPSNVTNLGRQLFFGDFKLTTVVINANIEVLKMGTFSNCSALNSVTLPESITTIEAEAFYRCSNLKTFFVSKNISSINSTAFNYCYSLGKILVDEDNEFFSSINGALCDKEKTHIIICPWSFKGSLNIPYGTTSINSSLLSQHSSLNAVYIPNSVSTISSSAFSSCTYLEVIYIPSSVTSIGNNAFSSCSNLISVLYGGTEEQWNNMQIGSGNDCITNAVIEYEMAITGFEDVDTTDCSYILASNNYVYNFINKDTSIYSFSFATQLPGLTIKTLKDFAFENCSNLGSIVIPEGVIKIGRDSFSCSTTPLLSNVSLPSTLKIIKDGAFAGCSNLTTVEIPFSVTYIGNRAFQNCRMESIILPSGLTEISEQTFGSCTSLKSVTIPYGVTKIRDFAFRTCSALESINIPSSVTFISNRAFYNCTSLASLVIPTSVIEFFDNPFVGSCSDGLFYEGTQSQWNAIISSSSITGIDIYFYSETEPLESGNYWHYVNEVPTKW